MSEDILDTAIEAVHKASPNGRAMEFLFFRWCDYETHVVEQSRITSTATTYYFISTLRPDTRITFRLVLYDSASFRTLYGRRQRSPLLESIIDVPEERLIIAVDDNGEVMLRRAQERRIVRGLDKVVERIPADYSRFRCTLPHMVCCLRGYIKEWQHGK